MPMGRSSTKRQLFTPLPSGIPCRPLTFGFWRDRQGPQLCCFSERLTDSRLCLIQFSGSFLLNCWMSLGYVLNMMNSYKCLIR